MSRTTSESRPSFAPGATAREMCLMASGSLVLLVVQVLMNNPRILFSRYLWIDELWTKLIESEPSVWQSLVALKHSGDPTPPGYHLLARASWVLIGGTGEMAFRILAFVSMWVALVLLYALLRRTFTVLPALVAVLAFWSSPSIIGYAFYARPYAPLLAATVGFCLIYGQDDKGPLAIALTAALAALICTLQYFGIFALASIVVGDTLARRETLLATVQRWLPVAAGPLALASCWPFFHTWKTGQTEFTFLPPETIGSAAKAALICWGGAVEATLLLILIWSMSALARLTARTLGHSDDSISSNIGRFQPIAGLLGLLLVPVMLAIFSFCAYSVMLTRYMAPGLLGVTALLAVVASNISPRILIGIVELLILLDMHNFRIYSAEQSRWQTAEQKMMTIGRFDQLPIVTFESHEAYLLYAYAPSLRGRLFIADFRPTHKALLFKGLLSDYELENKWTTVYPDLPKRVDLDQLRRFGKFHLVNPETQILTQQTGEPSESFPLQKIARLLAIQNLGELYEVQTIAQFTSLNGTEHTQPTP